MFDPTDKYYGYTTDYGDYSFCTEHFLMSGDVVGKFNNLEELQDAKAKGSLEQPKLKI